MTSWTIVCAILLMALIVSSDGKGKKRQNRSGEREAGLGDGEADTLVPGQPDLSAAAESADPLALIDSQRRAKKGKGLKSGGSQADTEIRSEVMPKVDPNSQHGSGSSVTPFVFNITALLAVALALLR